MPDNLLNILGFGLIGEAEDGNEYRYIIFEDRLNGHTVEYLLHKNQNPEFWSEIELLEIEKNSPQIKGFIITFCGKNFVVIGEESIQDALEKQNQAIEIIKRISHEEAEKLRLESKGYCTNLTHEGAMEIAWRTIDKKAKLVRFRVYKGKGNFSWNKWYEIERE